MRSFRIDSIRLSRLVVVLVLLSLATSCTQGEDPDPAKAFWSWFVRNERTMRTPSEERGKLIDLAYEKLQKVNQGLALEIGGDTQHLPMELVITAEGKKELFPLVENSSRKRPRWQGGKFTLSCRAGVLTSYTNTMENSWTPKTSGSRLASLKMPRVCWG